MKAYWLLDRFTAIIGKATILTKNIRAN